MKISNLASYFLLFSINLFSVLPVTRADTGPKPSMGFEFELAEDFEPLTIVSGILYECRQSDCSDAAPLEEVGPQGFYCDVDRCDALAYGFAPYHIIEIEFSDGKTRESNIFETAGFDSRYTVTVRPEDLIVEAQLSWGILPRTGTVILLCACFLSVGVLVIALALFVYRRTSTK